MQIDLSGNLFRKTFLISDEYYCLDICRGKNDGCGKFAGFVQTKGININSASPRLTRCHPVQNEEPILFPNIYLSLVKK